MTRGRLPRTMSLGEERAMLETQEVFIDGEAYRVYFHYYPAEHNYPREPDVPESIEIESVYLLLEDLGPQKATQIKQALLRLKRENEDAARS